MNMVVNDGDIHGVLKRRAVFNDNIEVVLEMVNGIHNRIYGVQDFDMVSDMSCQVQIFWFVDNLLRVYITSFCFYLQFVFPIYNATHHYIICYNMKKPSWEIIDNRVQTTSFADMFGDLPFRLVSNNN